MKIAMFTETYVPQKNGVATSVFLYKRALEERGHQVYVVTTVGSSSDELLVLESIQFKYESNHVIPVNGRLLPVSILYVQRTWKSFTAMRRSPLD